MIVLLFGKRKKLIEYLTKKEDKALTAFDMILSDYVAGSLKENLQDLGMKKINIYIDWLSNYKCINIQGKVDDYFFDIQIEPKTFSVAYDKNEPDDTIEFVLLDIKSFYNVLANTILNIKQKNITT